MLDCGLTRGWIVTGLIRVNINSGVSTWTIRNHLLEAGVQTLVPESDA